MPESYTSTAPETVDAKDQNDVSILIEGRLFKYWNDIEIVRSFDTIADQFTLSCPFFSNNMALRDLFRPFKYKPCAVYVGGERVLVGNIINIDTDGSANSKTISVTGYSKPGILSDCHPAIESWPLSINGLDLEQIAQKLALPYDILTVFGGEAEPGAKFQAKDRIEIDIDEKVYEILTKLARQRGLVISSDDSGIMLFRKTVEERATVTIEESKPPYLSSHASYNGQDRYSDITIVKTENSSGRGGKYTIQDPELTANSVFRHLVEKADDTEKGNIKIAATWKLGRVLAEAVSLDVNCVGWYRPDAVLWQDGQKILYYAPGDMIYEQTEFLIREAKLSKKNNAMETSLTIVLPESYSGEVRSEYPWAS